MIDHCLINLSPCNVIARNVIYRPNTATIKGICRSLYLLYPQKQSEERKNQRIREFENPKNPKVTIQNSKQDFLIISQIARIMMQINYYFSAKQ